MESKQQCDVKKCIQKFIKSCSNSPVYVCTVCHRLLFRNGVKMCDITNYSEKHHENAQLCITGKYVHVCDDSCSSDCEIKKSSYGSEWICFTCDSYLRKNKVPPQSILNKMNLSEIPKQLEQLNSLENQLIGQIVPFNENCLTGAW